MSSVEGFDLDARSDLCHLLRHLFKCTRGVGHHVVALAEVHRPAVERANLGLELTDVLDTLGSSGHVGANI